MLRPPPPELITPNLDWFDMFTPGLPQETEFVKLDASHRICSLYFSQILMSLERAILRPQPDGPRKLDRYGGSGVIVYWVASAWNALVSKYGFKTCRVTGSRTSPSRAETEPLLEGSLSMMGRPFGPVTDRG